MDGALRHTKLKQGTQKNCSNSLGSYFTTVDSKRLEHGYRMIYVGHPSFFVFDLKDAQDSSFGIGCARRRVGGGPCLRQGRPGRGRWQFCISELGSAGDTYSNILYICICTYVYTYVYMYVYIHICLCIDQFSYVYIYTHTYMLVC